MKNDDTNERGDHVDGGSEEAGRDDEPLASEEEEEEGEEDEDVDTGATDDAAEGEDDADAEAAGEEGEACSDHDGATPSTCTWSNERDCVSRYTP